MDKKETISNLNAKIKRRKELIEVLKDRIQVVQKRLDSDVIVDMRFFNEIQDDKEEIVTLKKEIEQLEKEIKQLKRSVAILESNNYSKEKCEHKMILGNVDDFYCAECNKQI